MRGLPQDVLEVVAVNAVTDVPTTLALRAVSTQLRRAVDTRLRWLVAADAPQLDPWRNGSPVNSDDSHQLQPTPTPPALALGGHLVSLLRALWESCLSPRPYRLAIVAFGLDGPKAPETPEAAWCAPAGRQLRLGGVFGVSRVLAKVPAHLQATPGLAEHLASPTPYTSIFRMFGPRAHGRHDSARYTSSFPRSRSGLPRPCFDFGGDSQPAEVLDPSATVCQSAAEHLVLKLKSDPRLRPYTLDLASLAPRLKRLTVDFRDDRNHVIGTDAPFPADVEVSMSFPPTLNELSVHDHSAQGLVNPSLRRLLFRPLLLRRATFATLRGLEALLPCAGTLQSLTLHVSSAEAQDVALTDSLADVLRGLEHLVVLDVRDADDPQRRRRLSSFATPSPALACLSCVADGRHNRLEHVYCWALGNVTFRRLTQCCPQLQLLRTMTLDEREVAQVGDGLWRAHRLVKSEPWFVSPRYAQDALAL